MFIIHHALPPMTAVPTALVRDSQLSAEARMVAVVMFSFVDEGTCREEVSDILNLSTEDVDSACIELMRRGYMTASNGQFLLFLEPTEGFSSDGLSCDGFSDRGYPDAPAYSKNGFPDGGFPDLHGGMKIIL